MEPHILLEASSELCEESEEPPSSAATGFSSLALPSDLSQTQPVVLTIHARARQAPFSQPRPSSTEPPKLRTVIARHSFRHRHFPQATVADWNDWRWQMRNRIRSLEALERILRLTTDERMALSQDAGSLPLAVTPYYASLLDPGDPMQPLRRTMVPVVAELARHDGEADDPLNEDGMSPVPGLVHRYPDRVLFMVADTCAAYCRYCTRSRMVGQGGAHAGGSRIDQWRRAIDYIQATPAIRDVLVSGGDPLTLDDDTLDWLLTQLRRIPHVEFLRIGTKAPIVLPQRVTRALAHKLRRHHPLWMSIHCTHPDELTPEAAQACARLADAGIPLGSQTVLLKGINDDVDTMKRLVHGLLKIRVRPYYLYQCDPITGSSHFRTSVEKGLEIIQGLRGYTTGYGVPNYVIDAPGGGGKTPITTNYVVGREGGDLILRNYEGKLYRYPDSA